MKPPATEKMVIINFTIPLSEKELWLKYTLETFGEHTPLSTMIKNTINRVINFPAPTEKKSDLDLIYEKIEESIQQSKVFIDNFKKEYPDYHADQWVLPDLLKSQILQILTDHPQGVSRKTLQSYTGAESVLLQNALTQLKEEGVISYDGTNWHC